jgi:tetratricopeptide (TPR) repeat protein
MADLLTLSPDGNSDYEALMDNVDWDRVQREVAASRKEKLPKLLITNEPMEEENFAQLPESVKEQLQMLGKAVTQQPEFVLSQVEVLKKNYPDVPNIYSIEANACMLLGDVERHFKINKEAVEKFPDYIFAKIALAEYYLRKEMTDEIKELFQGKFHIHHHYSPSDDGFYHISEIRAFYSIIGMYYATIGKIAQALDCYSMLVKLEGKTASSGRLAQAVVMAEMKIVIEGVKHLNQ